MWTAMRGPTASSPHTLLRRFVLRERLCLRGTTDYWVNDALGRPFLVVSKAVTEGLADALLTDIVPELLFTVRRQPSTAQLNHDPHAPRARQTKHGWHPLVREAAEAALGSELEGPLEWRQVRRGDEDFDRPRLAGHTANEAAPFEPHEHRVHRRRREVEEALQVGMAWRHASPIGCNVLADVGQELPLLARRSAGGCRGCGATDAVCGVELVQRRVHGIDSALHRVARLERGLVDDEPVVERGLKPGHALAQQFLRFGRGVSALAGLGIGVRVRDAGRTHGMEIDASISCQPY